MIRIFLIVVGVSFIAAPGFSQKDCKALLLDAAGKMRNFSESSLIMEYDVKTVIANYENDQESLASNQLHGSLSISKLKSKFVSGKMEMYKDSTLQIVVMLEERKIYVTHSASKPVWQTQRNVMVGLQDSLLKWVQVTGCETLCDPKDSKHITEKIDGVMMTPRLQESTGLSGITYWIDRKYNRISRIDARFTKHPQDVREIDFVITKYESGRREDIFKGSAYDAVFTAKNRPSQKYTGFAVIDYRDKTRQSN